MSDEDRLEYLEAALIMMLERVQGLEQSVRVLQSQKARAAMVEPPDPKSLSAMQFRVDRLEELAKTWRRQDNQTRIVSSEELL